MSQSDQENRVLGTQLIKKVGGMGQALHILNLVEDDAEYIGFMYLQYKLSSQNENDSALLLRDDGEWYGSSYLNKEFTNLVERRFICLKDLNDAVDEVIKNKPIRFDAEKWIYERKSAFPMVEGRNTNNSSLGSRFTYQPVIITANGEHALKDGDLIIPDDKYWAVQCPTTQGG